VHCSTEEIDSQYGVPELFFINPRLVFMQRKKVLRLQFLKGVCWNSFERWFS